MNVMLIIFSHKHVSSFHLQSPLHSDIQIQMIIYIYSLHNTRLFHETKMGHAVGYVSLLLVSV